MSDKKNTTSLKDVKGISNNYEYQTLGTPPKDQKWNNTDEMKEIANSIEELIIETTTPG